MGKEKDSKPRLTLVDGDLEDIEFTPMGEAATSSEEPKPIKYGGTPHGLMPTPGEKKYHDIASWVPFVTEDYLSGLNVQQISHKRCLDPKYVRFIICTASLRELADKHRQAIMEDLLKEQVPILKEVAGLSLASLREFLEELLTNPEKKAALTMKDAKDLSSILREQHNILKLELGEATDRVDIVHKVHKDVRTLLQDLKKSDPFVDYPALDITPNKEADADKPK